MSDDKILIKKYGNRRLYDTRQSKYINLEDIPGILTRGEDVVVVDANSGDDITSTVLLQIIMEREKRRVQGLPADLLKELIVLQNTPGKKFFDMAMSQSLRFVRQMRSVGFKPADMDATRLLDPSYWMDQFFGTANPAPEPPVAPEPPPAPAPAPEESDDIRGELERLRRRLEDIEERTSRRKG